ncbi:hypothetical protein IMF27_07210 [Pseudomonas sp. PCH199]|uniref:hypothetical protein n=1 Tax=unclassified Pseudomonas TaxID=196821 RepID=UPI000BD59939|nr:MULTISPECIES: hypothetical protein [unclassified Pseudomonas]MCW8275514.1 hypothetical protein [Pseudomonas sp. PCH199]PAM84388.1 hypothetical protein CES87_07410 [Pseudomonas sp. ERMR1:02]
MSSPLALYRTLPANLPEDFCLSTRYGFTSSSGEDPGAKAISENQYTLGTDSDWSADTHDLVVRCSISKTRLLQQLFEDGGLAASDGELLLALEWTSADSCWRTLSQPFLLTKQNFLSGEDTAELILHLPASSIRGNGLVTVQLLLGHPGSNDILVGLANQRGCRLGPLTLPIEIVIDGDGSLFPVQEEALGAEGALWEMRATWSDPRDEPFSSGYVALILNRDHELFDQLRERRTEPNRQSPLMRQVVSSWIALVIHQVKIDLGSDFDSILNHYGQSDDFASIADAVAAFIRLGELDTGSLSSLFATTQCWFDRRIRETGISK